MYIYDLYMNLFQISHAAQHFNWLWLSNRVFSVTWQTTDKTNCYACYAPTAFKIHKCCTQTHTHTHRNCAVVLRQALDIINGNTFCLQRKRILVAVNNNNNNATFRYVCNGQLKIVVVVCIASGRTTQTFVIRRICRQHQSHIAIWQQRAPHGVSL